MSKKTIRILSILSLMLALLGAGLIVAGVVGSPWTTTTTGNATTAHMTSFANLPLFVAGVVIAALALVPHLIAWAGALINLARLQQWGWLCVASENTVSVLKKSLAKLNKSICQHAGFPSGRGGFALGSNLICLSFDTCPLLF